MRLIVTVDDGRTPFHTACALSHKEFAQKLLNFSEETLIDTRDESGNFFHFGNFHAPSMLLLSFSVHIEIRFAHLNANRMVAAADDGFNGQFVPHELNIKQKKRKFARGGQ